MIGGVEVLSLPFIHAMQEEGFEFEVVTSHCNLDLPDEMLFEGIPVHRFHFHSALMRRNLHKLNEVRDRVANFKKKFNPDLIHLNSGHPSVFFHLHTCTAGSAPTLFTVHEPFFADFNSNSLKGRIIESADWVTAVSSAMLDDVRQLMPAVAERSSLILNGLPMPSVNPVPLSFDDPHILCFGRLSHEKGFDLALDAFAMLIERFPSIHLIIAGDGPARSDLEQQAIGLGLKNAVRFTGWVSPEEVPELINRAAIVLMPSRWREPFGLVALQAAQMARPVVASKVGGLPEIVIHGKTGLLAGNENIAELSESIAFLLEHPEEARLMGRAARKRAGEKFGFGEFVASYAALYHRIIKGCV